MTAPDPAPALRDLGVRIRACTACPELVAQRTTVVVGQQVPVPPLALVGEAPGAEEDLAGLPFVGRSGRLLDELLGLAGVDRTAIAVLNVLKCRPPGNRAPRREEVERCRPFLDRQLALLAPRVVVAMGTTAVAALLGRGTRIGDVRGRSHDVDGRVVVPTYHPAAALRFGPRGEPRRLLAADLVLAARLARA